MWRSSCSAISASGRSAPSMTKSTCEEPPSSPMGEDGGSSHVDFVMDGADLPDAEIAEQEERHIVQERVLEALGRLDPRERYIIEQRIMNDKPMKIGRAS